MGSAMNTINSPNGSRLGPGSTASGNSQNNSNLFPIGAQKDSAGDYTPAIDPVKSAIRQTLEAARVLAVERVLQEQMSFFRSNSTGCGFAAYAARNPGHFGWKQVVVDSDPEAVDRALSDAIQEPETSTLSLVFPDINRPEHLWEFVKALGASDGIFVGQDEMLLGQRCIGLRARVRELTSWITGFGNFEFLPLTRRAPHVELTIRTKARPDYKVILKEAPKMVVHLADMHLRGISRQDFSALWEASLRRTASILGHAPDLRSAAKTTFSFPAEFAPG